MNLDRLVEALRESGTSEVKLTVLRKIAASLPEGADLNFLVDEFAKHHNVTEGTVKKAKAILHDAAVAAKAVADAKAAEAARVVPPPPAPQSTRK